jgi:hypothetical protein
VKNLKIGVLGIIKIYLFSRLDDLNSKYRFMEMNLLQKKKRLRAKLPDIQICLGMVYLFLS